MPSPYAGFPLAASRNDDASVRRSQSNPERYRSILDDRSGDLLIKTPLDRKLVGDPLHLNTKGHESSIGRSPVDFSKWPPTLISSGRERAHPWPKKVSTVSSWLSLRPTWLVIRG